MLDSFLARYGNQDIHKLRGVDRPLTHDEKIIFAECLGQWLEREVEPLERPGSQVVEVD